MRKGKTVLCGSLVCVALVLAGCGGGGGSATALNVPEQVTLVEAQNSGASYAYHLPSNFAPANLTDYQKAVTRFWVQDDSAEALNTVNMILASVQSTRFWEAAVFNKGPYLALVETEQRGGAEGGQGRGGSAEVFERFILDSKRASPGAPHVVDFWVDTTSDGQGPSQPAIIYGKLVIEESPSARLPYGRFTMNFKQLLKSQAHDDPNPLFTGTLKSVPRNDGRAEFAFYNAKGDVNATLTSGQEAFRMRARLVTQPDGSSGQAYAESVFAFNPGGGTQVNDNEYFLEYNANYMVRKKVSGGSTIEGFDRKNFTTTVYRYGLYDNTTEAKVESLSGFGVETSTGANGWAGYHGLWFPDDVTITDGQQLIRRSYGATPTTTNYTAVVVPGRLEKRTRSATTLGNMKDEDLETFDKSTGTQMLVQWTGTDLVKVATHGQQGWTRLQTPVSVVSSYTGGQWVNFYSPHRGAVDFEWPGGGPTNSTAVFVWTQETITSDSPELAGGNLTLYAYFQMLKSGITQDMANYANSQTPFFADAANVGQGKTYVFNKTTLLLTLAGSPVTLANGVTVTSGPGMNGFNSGPMVTTALGALNEMANATTTFEWRTGTQNWTKLLKIKDAQGAFVTFTPPLRFNYTHNEPTNAKYHGKSFVLEWQGTDLHGIPHVEDTNDKRWYAEFNIPDGTVLTNGSGSYKTKALEGEQRMVAVADVNALIASQGFDLNVTLTPPVDEYVDPAIGQMPVVTAAPVYVGGVAQN